MFVLHEDCATVDIYDADGVSSAGRDQTCGLAGVRGIRLKHNLQIFLVSKEYSLIFSSFPIMLLKLS